MPGTLPFVYLPEMKKIFFAALAVAGLLFCSCEKKTVTESEDPADKEEQVPEGPVLTVSSSSLVLSYEAQTAFLTVSAESGVAVNYQAGWLDVDFNAEKKEDNLTFKVTENTGRADRSAVVTLSAKDCEDVEVTVTQERLKSSTCSLSSFALKKADNSGLRDDIRFDYDERTRTFSAMYLRWISGDSPEMLAPVFSTDGEKVTVAGAELLSGSTKISFADDFTVTVVAENGNTCDYKVTLNCPQINRELAVLHFKPESEITGKDFYVQTDIELYDKTPESKNTGWWKSGTDGKVEMRGRGNSTWGLPKKPFRLKFPSKFSPVGLDHAKAKSWTLLAHDMDKSLIRNHIALEYSRILFNPSENYHDPAAVLFTPASKYVNVYITGYYTDSSTGRREYRDGEYLGVYQMSDQVQRAKGRIEVESLKNADGSDPSKITGGYVLEADLHEGNNYTSHGIKLSYKYPEDDDYDQSQYDYISNFINEAESALYGRNYTDSERGWRKYFDERTLADFIIVKELAGDLDGYTSTYFYKRRNVGKLFFGPIWDCDKGWNNDKRVPHWEYPPLQSLMIKAGFWMPPYVQNDWFWRFWSDPSFRRFVAERWAQKKDALLAATDRILDEMPVRMKKAIDANFEVWPFYYQFSDEANMPASNYHDEIERIRRLTRERAQLLDRLFNE